MWWEPPAEWGQYTTTSWVVAAAAVPLQRTAWPVAMKVVEQPSLSVTATVAWKVPGLG